MKIYMILLDVYRRRKSGDAVCFGGIVCISPTQRKASDRQPGRMKTFYVHLTDFPCAKSDHSHAQWRECVSCAISEAGFMEIPSMADK